MTNTNEAFGRLLKAGISSIANYEGKTNDAVERDLGEQIGIAGATIQRYKTGKVPTERCTIEIIAEAAVKRGLLSREWLQRFLHAARYYDPDKLLERLCPSSPTRPRPAHTYQNLPAPTYSQFVMRPVAFADVIDGLAQRSAAVIISSLGGMGKTSLAREVAARCIQPASDPPQFEAVVWVSDKDRPGTTNLSVVLDEIARTLDYPGFTQFEHEEKQREVEQLLRRQRVLLVVDNFETITDGALLQWLLRLPEPSKAVITTREYRREYRRGGWPVELRGMSETEARELVSARLRVLKMDEPSRDQSQLEPLIAVTGGNPKAIEMALGCVKYSRQLLQNVIDDLYAARGVDDLFEDLFARCWSLLDEASRRVLLAMPLFPDSASGEALSATADVQGFAFDRAVERLTDLALLDVQQTDLEQPVRYALHPLVRVFAGARLTESEAFERGARERWVGFYRELATRIAELWEDLPHLATLDSENETAYAVIKWTSEHDRYVELLQCANGFSHYYYVRGLWNKRQTVNLMAIEATQKLTNVPEEVRALAFQVQLLCKQANFVEAETYMQRMCELGQSTYLPNSIFGSYQHAIGLFLMKARNNIDAAQQAWEKSLRREDERTIHSYVVDRRWIAICLYKKGMLVEAQRYLCELLGDAIHHGLHRSTIFCLFKLALINLDLGNLDIAEQQLAESRELAVKYQDREYMAEIQRLYAKLCMMRNDNIAARTALTDVIDFFNRLGMRDELTEAQTQLANIHGE